MNYKVIKSDWVVYEQPVCIGPSNGAGDPESGWQRSAPVTSSVEEKPADFALEALVQEEMQEMLEDAKCTAKEITEQANRDAEQMLEGARVTGYEEGYQAGMQETESLQQKCRETISRIEGMAFDKYKTALDNAEHDVVRMIMDIAEKVIYDRMEDRKETILHIVRNAMEKASLEETLTLKLAPEDYEQLMLHSDQLFEHQEQREKVSLVQDETLAKGSCLIESPTGTMDASVDTVLKNIDDSFSELSPRIAG